MLARGNVYSTLSTKKRLREKGSFAKRSHAAGRPKTTRTPALLHKIEQRQETSTTTTDTNLQ